MEVAIVVLISAHTPHNICIVTQLFANSHMLQRTYVWVHIILELINPIITMCITPIITQHGLRRPTTVLSLLFYSLINNYLRVRGDFNKIELQISIINVRCDASLEEGKYGQTSYSVYMGK